MTQPVESCFLLIFWLHVSQMFLNLSSTSLYCMWLSSYRILVLLFSLNGIWLAHWKILHLILLHVARTLPNPSFDVISLHVACSLRNPANDCKLYVPRYDSFLNCMARNMQIPDFCCLHSCSGLFNPNKL